VRSGRVGRLLDSVRSLPARWTPSRRLLAPAGLLALGAVAMVTLAASAVLPRTTPTAAEKRPNYLTPVGTLVHHGWLPYPTLTGDHGGIGVPAGTPQVPSRPDPAEAARQAPAIAGYQGAPGTLTPAGIASLALQAGCDPEAAIIATAVAMAESGGSPSAQGDIGLMTPVWDWSAGLWQIRGLRAERNSGGIRDSVANQDVNHNARAMFVISGACTDWTPWSTYNSGTYLQFMSIAGQAVRYAVAYYNAHGQHYPPVPPPDPTATVPSQGTGTSGTAVQAGGGPATTAARSSGATRNSTGAPKPAHSSTVVAQPKQSSSSAAGAPATSQAPAPTSSSKTSLIPLPIKTSPLPIKTTTLPLPLPTTSLVPLPSLSLPGIP
jgi:Lysozyme like domain